LCLGPALQSGKAYLSRRRHSRNTSRRLGRTHRQANQASYTSGMTKTYRRGSAPRYKKDTTRGVLSPHAKGICFPAQANTSDWYPVSIDQRPPVQPWSRPWRPQILATFQLRVPDSGRKSVGPLMIIPLGRRRRRRRRSLFRFVHARGAIPNEVGPTRSRV
jgi:hypothetical protein